MKKLLTFLLGAWLVGCSAPQQQPLSIVPYPNQVAVKRGTFEVKNQAIACDEALDEKTQRAIGAFATQLATISGGENPLSAEGTIRFVLAAEEPAEGYTLEVGKQGIEVRASQFAGFLYAMQSLKQLLPPAIYGTEPAPEAQWEVPCVKIVDAPRFAYRGMHLDVARHFFPIEEVKRYLDMMALHKMNRFHWHLTDDQGWRIEIKKYPRLTEVGSVRKQTCIGLDWTKFDGVPYGGYYTQEQIREVGKYAEERGITIVPEIDLPGHMIAALTAFPELGCTGGPYEVWGRWGIADEVLCAGNEQVYTFLENVLAEVIELFPSEVIHIGGDECPKKRWEKCPRCQAKIRELGLTDKDGFKAEHYLQAYITERIGKFVASKGRRILGWDEILEGKAPQDAIIMSWQGSKGGIAAAKLGHDVVMTPNSHFYFDYCQSLDRNAEPISIGGYLPVEQVYSFDPYDQLSEEQQKHILGVQANLWTEYIQTVDHLHYMLLPRMSALSEVQWCQPEVRNWERFLGQFRMDDIYTVMGFNFAKHIYEISDNLSADTQQGEVLVALSTAGNAPIYYTLDGSEPTTASARYTEPIAIRESCTLQAIADHKNLSKRPTYTKTFTLHKAVACPVTLNQPANRKYLFACPTSFVDGHHGTRMYKDRSWVGFMDNEMDLTLDMKGRGDYSSVMVESLVEKVRWIFPPRTIEVLLSDDGEHFTSVATLNVPEETPDTENGIKHYTVEFPATSARYLRIVATTVNPIPSWHKQAAGGKAHLFIGELEVE